MPSSHVAEHGSVPTCPAEPPFPGRRAVHSADAQSAAHVVDPPADPSGLRPGAGRLLEQPVLELSSTTSTSAATSTTSVDDSSSTAGTTSTTTQTSGTLAPQTRRAPSSTRRRRTSAARSTTTSAPAPPPARSASPSRPPKSVTLATDSTLTECTGVNCLSNAGENTPTLAYGQSITLGPFTCASSTAGMKCTLANGDGFSISSARDHGAGQRQGGGRTGLSRVCRPGAGSRLWITVAAARLGVRGRSAFPRMASTEIEKVVRQLCWCSRTA